MGYLTSLPEGEEARKVDLHMEAALDFQTSWWKNARITDVTGAIEACEEQWPAERLLELSHCLHDMATMNTAALPPTADYAKKPW
jgi:hypothetical protein